MTSGGDWGNPRACDGNGAKGLNLLAEAPVLCHTFPFEFRARSAGVVSIAATASRANAPASVIRKHIGNGCSGIRKTPARGG